MKAEDWKMIGYLGIVLGFLFFAIGGWIWLNVEGYMGWVGWLKYLEYRNYPITLFTLGIVFLIVGFTFIWRATEERKQVPVRLKKCPKCGMKFSAEYEYCPMCRAKLELA